MVSDSQFTRTLVRALQVPHSFHFPFDSVKGISKLYAPDSSFRIITWNLQYNDYYNRQRGAIQLNTKNGSLKLFPLRDASEFTDHPEDSIRTAKNWVGATYYNIIKKEFQGKPFYTLFGIDANNAKSTIKWMEVLHFTQQGEPLFGGPFFSYQKDSVVLPTQYRIQLEYKKDASILMNYIPEMDLILIDHLISENNDVEHKWTYVPDGDQARRWVDRLPEIRHWKVGLELFVGSGPAILHHLQEQGKGIFLDLKFHDIPNTMAGACRAAAQYGVTWLTVHATAGREGLRQAQEALASTAHTLNLPCPNLLAVTLLTSLNGRDLAFDLKVSLEVMDYVQQLALLAQENGAAGVVCSQIGRAHV